MYLRYINELYNTLLKYSINGDLKNNKGLIYLICDFIDNEY